MNHTSQSRAQYFEEDAIKTWEYGTESTAMNVARIELNGRYPEEGLTVNREVDSIVHIVSGEGTTALRKAHA